MNAEILLLFGTAPYETKTILHTQWVMKGMQNGQREIYLIPRRSAGVAHAKKMGELHFEILPDTDLPVVNAIARVIVENDWEDSGWIRDRANHI
jgi:arsenite oxidase large subunit